MILARVLPRVLAKEVRALLPIWLGCLAVIGAAAVSNRNDVRMLAILTYLAGSLALGALSIGHEYLHRTLPLLLSQPFSRAHLLAAKLGVVFVMLIILALAAWRGPLPGVPGAAMILWLALLGGLVVAPWMTMLARNPLAGMVFTIAIPGLTWILATAIVDGPYNLRIFQGAMVGVSAMAAVLGRRAFMRLEAVEGPGSQLHFRMGAEREAPARRRHPVWLLVKKDLGLQQLTFVVAAIYVLLAVSLAMLSGSGALRAQPVEPVTLLYSGLLAMLIGSLASAEERQFGTLEWQMLLPMASWKQWMVKAGTALTLSLLLAFALPALVIASAGRGIRVNEWYAVIVLLLTTASLYVSSLCASGLRAFLISPAVPVGVMVVLRFLRPEMIVTRLAFLPIGGWLLLVLFLAMANHRSAERGMWRMCQQAFILVGCAALGGAFLGLVDAFRHHR